MELDDAVPPQPALDPETPGIPETPEILGILETPEAPEPAEPQAGEQQAQTPDPPAATAASRFGPEHAILAALTALAAVAYAWGLAHGSFNDYYAAAVRSMTHSWHDFLFGSFDPDGTVSIDKLPPSLWPQVVAVRLFGFHIWTMLLPDVIAGALIVPAAFRATRRVAGPRAALAAALIVAATPAALAEARGNEADPISVLLLVLAAGAVLRAVTESRFSSLMLAAVWIGLAFQIKMGEAWLPVPAFAAGYLAAAAGPMRRRLARLAAAGAVLAVVSLSWMALIAATPAGQRPYADGTTDNSVFSQVFDYNGFGRFDDGTTFGLPRPTPPSPESEAYTRQSRLFERQLSSGSTAAWNRLVDGDIGRAVGWLLPVALAAGAVVLVARRREPRTDAQRAAVVVFGGWLLTDTVLFSLSRTLPAYYTGMLVPPIAVLCTLGLKTTLAATSRRNRWPAAAAVLAAGAWGAWLSHSGGAIWPVVIGVLTGAAAVAVAGLVRVPKFVAPVLTLAAVLAGPLAASGWMVAHGGSAWDAPYSAGGTAAEPSPALVDQFRTHPIYGATIVSDAKGEWERTVAGAASINAGTIRGQRDLVVFSSAEASVYVASGVDRVLAVGGFTGLVPGPDPARLSELLDEHKIAFAILPGPLDSRSADPRIALLTSRCVSRRAVHQDDGLYLYICP